MPTNKTENAAHYFTGCYTWSHSTFITSFRNLIFGIITVGCGVIGQLVVKSLSVKQTNCVPW